MKVEKSLLCNLSKQASKSEDRETDWKLNENLSITKILNKSKRTFYDNKISNPANIATTVWGIINSEVGNKILILIIKILL